MLIEVVNFDIVELFSCWFDILFLIGIEVWVCVILCVVLDIEFIYVVWVFCIVCG